MSDQQKVLDHLDNALAMVRKAYEGPGPMKDLHLLAVCIDAMDGARTAISPDREGERMDPPERAMREDGILGSR